MRLLTLSSCSGQSLVSSGVTQAVWSSLATGHLCKATMVLTVKGGAQLATLDHHHPQHCSVQVPPLDRGARTVCWPGAA